MATLAPWAQAQTRGLTAAPDALGGPVWQTRFERDASTLPSVRGLATWLAPAGNPHSLRLLGDYQFSALRLGQTGGLRLTGGLLINLRQSANGLVTSGNLSAQPYAGVGYASGSLDGRWGFSADLGLAGGNQAALLPDRPAFSLGADSLPRLLPMVRLGMTLSF
ncbi:MAG: hypothetical protein QE285_13885 [Aquabacterium sp.]|nr:hypothetical protein [Aquabacterium sp.]